MALGIRNLDNSDFHALETYLEGPGMLVEQARRLAPRTRVVVGGSAGTVEPERVIRVTGCDYLILGEGEESLPQLIARLDAGQEVPRLVSADNNGAPFRVTRPEGLPAPGLHRWVE